MGLLIRGKPSAFASRSLRFWHTSDPHPKESEAETRLRYSSLNCSFRCGGFSWHMIEVHPQLRSSIQSRMSFLNIYEANVDKLRVIMDLSFQPRHATRATNQPPKHIYFQYVVRWYSLVCFIRIMFSSTLN